MCVCVCVWWCLVAKSSLTFTTPWIVAHQAPLPMGFPRQESYSRLSFPSPRDLRDPEIKPESPELAGGFFTIEPSGKHIGMHINRLILFIKCIKASV